MELEETGATVRIMSKLASVHVQSTSDGGASMQSILAKEECHRWPRSRSQREMRVSRINLVFFFFFRFPISLSSSSPLRLLFHPTFKKRNEEPTM